MVPSLMSMQAVPSRVDIPNTSDVTPTGRRKPLARLLQR
jgi:hypothetical protein